MAALRQTTISAMFANLKAAASSLAPPLVGGSTAPEAGPEERATSTGPSSREEHDAGSFPPTESLSPNVPITSSAANAIASAAANLPDAASIEPLSQPLLPSFRRLITTLLPVRYPDKTYGAILANAEGNVLCRLALWHPAGPAAACSSETTRGSVVGAVCARVEDLPSPEAGSAQCQRKELYVQMLAVLSPYRSQGLASALLEGVVAEAVRAWGVARVSAHVWEANDDALAWYARRGFVAETELVRNYYRKLKPDGAWLMTKNVGIVDGLKN